MDVHAAANAWAEMMNRLVLHASARGIAVLRARQSDAEIIASLQRAIPEWREAARLLADRFPAVPGALEEFAGQLASRALDDPMLGQAARAVVAGSGTELTEEQIDELVANASASAGARGRRA